MPKTPWEDAFQSPMCSQSCAFCVARPKKGCIEYNVWAIEMLTSGYPYRLREQALTQEEISNLCSLHKGIDLDEEGGDEGSECDEDDERYDHSEVTPTVHLSAPLRRMASLREGDDTPFRESDSLIKAESDSALTLERLLVREDLDEDGLSRAIRENFDKVRVSLP